MPLNPLGAAETEADWEFVVETIARRSPVPPVGADLECVHVAYLNSLARDMQLTEATGRWLFSRQPNRQPTEYEPGDVLALRARTVVDYVFSTPEPKGPKHPLRRRRTRGTARNRSTLLAASRRSRFSADE